MTFTASLNENFKDLPYHYGSIRGRENCRGDNQDSKTCKQFHVSDSCTIMPEKYTKKLKESYFTFDNSKPAPTRLLEHY